MKHKKQARKQGEDNTPKQDDVQESQVSIHADGHVTETYQTDDEEIDVEDTDDDSGSCQPNSNRHAIAQNF